MADSGIEAQGSVVKMAAFPGFGKRYSGAAWYE